MTDIVYPKNINVSGFMSFPLYSEDNIDQLGKWRADKSIAKPRYDDRIGFSLFLNQKAHDHVVKNLLEVYLPFAATLQKVSEKKRGINPKLVEKLRLLVKNEDWSESNLPIRDLNDKDIANLAKNDVEGIVSKIKVAGPPNSAAIPRKAIIKDADTGELEVVSLGEVEDRMGDQTDPDKLWWGASWPFRTNIRFNAFEAASFGVSAYVKVAYLLADQELKQFGAGDSAVLEDGDDWSDDE